MINACFVCLSQKIKPIFKKGSSEIVQCQNCGFGMLRNYPTLDEVKTIYRKAYFDHNKISEFRSDAQKKFKFVQNYLPKKAKILDFGCGTGDFIGICKESHHDVYGYDISAYAAALVSKRHHILVNSGRLREDLFGKDFFDAIVSFDVIEHAPNFKEILKLFHNWLKPDGVLFLTTPNIESWEITILRSRWYGFTKVPDHINYFSPRSIKLALKEAGLAVSEIKRWGFVRTPNFLLNKLGVANSPFLKVLQRLFKLLKVNQKEFYFPFVDMMVTAQKL